MYAIRSYYVVGIQAAQQPRMSGAVVPAHIVAGGDVVGTQLLGCELQEGLELDLPVAQDVRIGGTTGLVFV